MINWFGFSTHGVNFFPELTGHGGPLTNLPGTDYVDVNGLPQGFGKTFRGKAGRTNWFHVAIPTLRLYQHSPARLGEVQVAFQTFGTACVTNIHLHSGHSSHLPQSRSGLRLVGDFRARFEQNWFLFEPPIELNTGALCVSILVNFGREDSNILFTNAYTRFVAET